MGYGDTMHEIPPDVLLETENNRLRAALENANALLCQAKIDIADARQDAARPLAGDPDLNEQLRMEKDHAEDIEEKYETAQEMLKLYRRLVKVPLEDVGGGMSVDEYIDLARRTDNNTLVGHSPLSVAALGLCGEAGEFADAIKKWIAQGHELDTQSLVEELGDILWYWAKACRELGISGDVVAQKNIEKLRRRYPDGFDASRSINREDLER